MSHHIERCACGAILKFPAELDTGICLACLQRGECGGPTEEPPGLDTFSIAQRVSGECGEREKPELPAYEWERGSE